MIPVAHFKEKKRYLLDTNTLISGLLFKDSLPAQCLAYCVEHGVILTSQDCLEEIEKVLNRKKFDSYLSFEERSSFFKQYVDLTLLIHPVPLIKECRDPKDDIFLSLTVAGLASCLITGDRDLIVMHPFRGIPILSPEKFLRYR